MWNIYGWTIMLVQFFQHTKEAVKISPCIKSIQKYKRLWINLHINYKHVHQSKIVGQNRMTCTFYWQINVRSSEKSTSILVIRYKFGLWFWWNRCVNWIRETKASLLTMAQRLLSAIRSLCFADKGVAIGMTIVICLSPYTEFRHYFILKNIICYEITQSHSFGACHKINCCQTRVIDCGLYWP